MDAFETLTGTSPPVFIGLTVVLMGFAALMTGIAIADTWRPRWQVVFYCALLAAVARFLNYALFQGELLSLAGYLLDGAVLISIGLLAHRVAHVNKMVRQYPWLYRHRGPLAYQMVTGQTGANGESS
ncbi:MAG: DUF6867 family protein [Candidatus Competibacterales bacterium]